MGRGRDRRSGGPARRQRLERQRRRQRQLARRKAGLRPRRLRWAGGFPEPHATVEAPFARCREIHDVRSHGEITYAITQMRAWQDIMVTACEKFDVVRAGKRGPGFEYRSIELETFFLFQYVSGKLTRRAARDYLAGDRGRWARTLLGFDYPRKHPPKRGNPMLWLLDGVPSEATLSRYCADVGAGARAQVWQQLKLSWRVEYLQLLSQLGTGMDRVLYGDGSHIRVRGECPHYPKGTQYREDGTPFDPETDEVVGPINGDRVASQLPGELVQT